MAEALDSQQIQPQSETEDLSKKLDKMNISSAFNIWPPSQRTRDAVINRLIETLSTPSVLSKRYGSLDPEESSAIARSIEEEAFNAVGGSGADSASIDDGIEILQMYSKEISKRMLDAVKSRATGATPEVSSVKSPDEAPIATSDTVTSEEVSSVDNESSN